MTLLRLTCLVAVLVGTVVGVAVFVRGAARLTRAITMGRPAPGRSGPVGRRVGLVLREMLGHGRFQHSPVVKVAHWTVMVSFPILFFTLVTGYGQILDPTWTLPVLGHLLPWEWLTEAIAWLSLAGILALIAVRVRLSRRPSSRFSGSNQAQAAVVEGTVLAVVLAVLLLRGLEHRLGGGSVWHFPTTAWIGDLFTGVSTGTVETLVVLCATVKILVSMSWFVVVGSQPTMGIAWHRFLAVVNIYARRYDDGRPALGPLLPVRVDDADLDVAALESLPEDARLGARAVEDLSWKQLLDVATCTECGRCQDQCPAWATGKPLSPKRVVMALRDQAAATAPYLTATGTGTGTDDTASGHVDVDLVASGVIDADALWACTTCGACVQQCPVDIEHVDTIVDIRRYQTLMESAFPAELAGTFTKLERRGNPWGLPARQRLKWAAGLDFEVPVIGADLESAEEVDYLFWVGCAGSFEEKAMRTTRAVAELLHAAGVSFAVLGEGEGCTGDPARRAGNEVLFQMLAAGNVETLNAARAQAVVVTCAHCFNTLSREYPQLGGHYDVVHHTELLNRLVAEGRLVPVEPAAAVVAGPGGVADPGAVVTYHDPCYLGRHNQVYSPPRELLAAAGVQVTEMPRTREQSFCCGAGGARMWIEESIGTRIGTARAQEAIDTGAGAIATACPFCTVMLTDGVAAADRGDIGVPEVSDIAVLLSGRLRGA